MAGLECTPDDIRDEVETVNTADIIAVARNTTVVITETTKDKAGIVSVHDPKK